jgi:hypothetical protein
MPNVTSTTFWAALTIVASAIGGLVVLAVSHAGEPRHAEAAAESAVTSLQVKVEGIASDVGHNRYILEEVKVELRDMRIEQNAYTERVLEAIEGGR